MKVLVNKYTVSRKICNTFKNYLRLSRTFEEKQSRRLQVDQEDGTAEISIYPHTRGAL
jgi:hypothetical protein|tara:strand:+ start:297 stop:470 length:174 start_codon:yes stop_codon:yes gene_type:complete